jgi:hypothetical protein
MGDVFLTITLVIIFYFTKVEDSFSGILKFALIELSGYCLIAYICGFQNIGKYAAILFLTAVFGKTLRSIMEDGKRRD